MSSDAAREAWRTILAIMWQGEAAGRMRDVCQSIGIAPSMIKSLMHLEEDAPQAMRDLADSWGCDASYVTALIDDLEARGFAERRPHPSDRRVKTVVLTAEGAEVRRRITSRLWEPPAGFSSLSCDEQRQLCELLNKVARADAALASGPRGAGMPVGGRPG